MRFLGIDFGMKRIGVALSDEGGRFSYPYTVLSNDKNILKKLFNICKKERVGKVVLGRSLDFTGKPNKVMGDIELFKNELEEMTSLPIEYENEFLTTAEAERIQGKNNKTDASAAALILKSYIDRKVK